MAARYQRSKLITAANTINAVTLCIFILGKLFWSQNQQSGSFPSLIDSVAFLGFGLAGSLWLALYGYQAWLLDLASFVEWHTCQQIISNDWEQEWYGSFPGWNIRSQYRLMGPVGLLVGLAMAILGLFMITRPLFSS